MPIPTLIAALVEQRNTAMAEVYRLHDELREVTAELRELRAIVLARHRADTELAALYRERQIQLAGAAQRDPVRPLQ